MRIIAPFFLLMLTGLTGFAQAYVPFPTDSAEWVLQRYNAGNGGPSSSTYYSYQMDGDTLINDTLYSKIYENYQWQPTAHTLVAGMREEGQKVYGRMIGPNGMTVACQLDDPTEFLLYDFTLDEPGDSLVINHPWLGEIIYIVQTIDSVDVNGAPRRRINCNYWSAGCSPFGIQYIEGVGSDRHPFFPVINMTYEVFFNISCFTIEGVQHFSNIGLPPQCDLSTIVEVDEFTPITDPPRATLGPQGIELQLPNALGTCSITLIDYQGRFISTTPSLGKSTIYLNVDGLTSGLYLVRIVSDARPGLQTIPVAVVR